MEVAWVEEAWVEEAWVEEAWAEVAWVEVGGKEALKEVGEEVKEEVGVRSRAVSWLFTTSLISSTVIVSSTWSASMEMLARSSS